MLGRWRTGTDFGATDLRRELVNDIGIPLIGSKLHVFVVGDEGARITDERNEMHIPTTDDADRQKTDEVRRLVVEEEMCGRLVEESLIAIRLAQAIVEVKMLRTRPDAPLSDPEQAGVARLERVLEVATERRQLRNAGQWCSSVQGFAIWPKR